MPPNSNSKAKNDGQKLAIKKDKPEAGMIDEDGPIVDSPIAIDFEEGHPGGSQDNLPGATHPECQAPDKSPCCQAYPTDVLPNDDNPFSAL